MDQIKKETKAIEGENINKERAALSLKHNILWYIIKSDTNCVHIFVCMHVWVFLHLLH